MKRDKNDEKWQLTKQFVLKRDRGCRLLKVLSAQNALLLIRQAGNRLNILDPAHVFPVGAHPSMAYDKDNVVALNRYSHECLDNCKDPITGKLIDKETRDTWWELIVGKDLFEKLEQRSKMPGENA